MPPIAAQATAPWCESAFRGLRLPSSEHASGPAEPRVLAERGALINRQGGYDSFFCAPGIDGTHDKGGVEGEIGSIRRPHPRPPGQR
jgi:hypothetical protein